MNEDALIRWMDGLMDDEWRRWMYGGEHPILYGWIDEYMNEYMNGYIVGGTDGWIDGRMDTCMQIR